MKNAAAILLAIAATITTGGTTLAQVATWKGRTYSQPICPNDGTNGKPFCAMCWGPNGINAQIQAQRTAQFTATARPPRARTTTEQGTEYDLVTTMEPQVTRVKRCNGRTCWYENVTTYREVTRRVARAPSEGAQKPPEATPEPAIDRSTVTELAPTPQEAVLYILRTLRVTKDDKVADLGSGDGRIVVTAAKLYGCQATGIELNPESAELSRQNALAEFVAPLVTIHEGDVRNYDLHPYDVVTMYLYPELMEQVVPKLREGTRVASYLHDIPGMATVEHRIGNHTIYTGIR